MRTRAAAERWIAEELERAAPAFREGAEGLAYASLREYERSLRARAERSLRSVEEYVGLTVEEAEALAAEKGDELCVHRTAHQGHRANWKSNRVHIAVRPGDGLVGAAKLDREPW